MVIEQRASTAGADRTVADYAAAVGSAAPTPGGGSVCGTTAALAAGLIEMVSRLTIARESDATRRVPLQSLVDQASESRDAFLALAEADEAAYGAYRAASALPRASDAEKAARREAIERALLAAADVPRRLLSRADRQMTLAAEIAEHGTIHAVADIATAAELTRAAAYGAARMVRANTVMMKDRETAANLELETDAVRRSIDRSYRGAIETLDRRGG